MRVRWLAFLPLFALMLGGCELAASDDLGNIEGRGWAAVSIGGSDVVGGSRVTLKFEGGRVSGRAGCNNYGGGAKISGDQLKVTALFSTKMACMAPGLMEQEQRFLSLLQDADTVALRDDGVMVLTTSDGKTIAFRPE